MRRLWRKRYYRRGEVEVLLSRAQWAFLEYVANDNRRGVFAWRNTYGINVETATDVVQAVNRRVMEEA